MALDADLHTVSTSPHLPCDIMQKCVICRGHTPLLSVSPSPVASGMPCRDVFSAGASHYGVADLEMLAKETHKFESRYLDGLIGPYPEKKDVYEQRSPIHSLDTLTAPTAFFQASPAVAGASWISKLARLLPWSSKPESLLPGMPCCSFGPLLEQADTPLVMVQDVLEAPSPGMCGRCNWFLEVSAI